jgi:hypothetical protein
MLDHRHMCWVCVGDLCGHDVIVFNWSNVMCLRGALFWTRLWSRSMDLTVPPLYGAPFAHILDKVVASHVC